jgi:hypothetical protein
MGVQNGEKKRDEVCVLRPLRTRRDFAQRVVQVGFGEGVFASMLHTAAAVRTMRLTPWRHHTGMRRASRAWRNV